MQPQAKAAAPTAPIDARAKFLALRSEGMSVRAIADRYGIARTAVTSIIAETARAGTKALARERIWAHDR